MKRLVGFLACALAASAAILITAPPSSGQGQGGPSGDITAVRTGSASGLSGGAERGVADLTLRTDCSSGSGVAWDGSSWECAALGAAYTAGDGLMLTGSDFDVVLGDGLEIISDTVSITNDCSDGQVLKSASSGTQWNCAADTDTNTTYSAGTNSLTLTSTTFTIADRDFGDITVGSTGTTLTIDNSTVTSAKLNITTTSCSAGQHVSAISAGGVGTCTASGGLSGLTTGIIPTATSATTIGDGRITDDGTNPITLGGFIEAYSYTTPIAGVQSAGNTNFAVRNTTANVELKILADASAGYVGTQTGHNFVLQRSGATKLTITASSVVVADDLYGSNGDVYTQGSTDSLNFVNATNGAATGYINAVGYNGSTTQTRSLEIDDGTGTGAGNRIAFFDGTDLSTNFYGKVTATSTFEAQGTVDLTGPNINLGNGSGDLTRTNGVFGDVGTLPTLSSCGTSSRTGGQWSFTVTPGSTTACTATFASACAATPTCSVTPGYSTTAINYISAVSTSAITFNVTGTGWNGSQPVHVVCICH